MRPNKPANPSRCCVSPLTTSMSERVGIGSDVVRRTSELSHAGPRTQANPRLPGKPEAFPGVGCSDLVRQSKGHRLKNLRSDSFRKRCDNRPGQCARNVTEKPAKLTKRNPRRRREMAQPPNSTGGNGGNRGSIPSQFAPLPPVQTAQRRPVMPNAKLTDGEERAKDNRIATCG